MLCLDYFFFEKVPFTSIADIPAPRPINTQTINRKVCAPNAIGELKTSSSIIISFSLNLTMPEDNFKH